MFTAINRFRAENGIEPIKYSDNLVNHYCKLHCLDMARNHDIYHAPECYLDGWSEAVAITQYSDNWSDKIVFDVLGSSENHRNILLHNSKISCAEHVDNWMVYVTIRGRND